MQAAAQPLGWLEEVVASFTRLGGEATYKAIYDDIAAKTTRCLTPRWQSTVRRVVEVHSDSTAKKQTNLVDLFHSVHGNGKGPWRLVTANLSSAIERRLRIVTEPEGVRRAQRELQRAFSADAKRVRITYGTPGGIGNATAYWHETYSLWGTFNEAKNGSRFWNAFGTRLEQQRSKAHTIVCEINPSLQSKKNTGGLFIEDPESGVTFLAHRGSFGGTFAGQSHLFWSAYDGPAAIVTTGNIAERFVVVSALSDPNLIQNIDKFVRAVERFKARTSAQAVEGSYNAEFAGKKEYERVGYVTAECNHGYIVAALRDRLATSGFTATNTQRRDLEVRSGSDLAMLFEVKTGVDSHSIYTAVGQLFCNGRASHGNARLAIVVPERPAEHESALGALAIAIITYTLDGAQATFVGLGTFLDAAVV